MDAKCIKLSHFIGANKKTFNIPVYQRNYDWKKEQCEQLFNDIKRILDENFNYQHFLGTIVYVQGRVRPNFMELTIIDGQQRITTVMLLMKALYDVMTDVDKKADILECYLTNVRTEEKYRVKLKPIKTDFVAYKNLLDDGKIIEDSNITKNYKFFAEKIAQSTYTPEEIYEAIASIDIVYISLDKEKPSENPQLIFESLNSTGLSLLPSDLIRNFLLMRHSYERQEELYEKYWLKIESNIPNSQISDFVRDYLTMKTGVTPIRYRVYIDFKEYFRKNELSEEKILSELLNYSLYYRWLLNAKTDIDKINKLLLDINEMRYTVVYPPLLCLFEKTFNKKQITIDELTNILELLVCFLFRRVICSYPSNALNKLFATLCRDLESFDNSSSYYSMLATFLCSRTSTSNFPRDLEFKEHFISRDWINVKSLWSINTLLKFEKYLSKEIIDTKNIQIEHIMPQALSPQWKIRLGNKAQEIHDKYLHTIGNITLTGYNGKLSNFDFARKKETYKDSNIAICRELANYDEWNEESIKKRAEAFYNMAVEIWRFPKEYEQSAGELDYDLEFSLEDNISVTGEKPKELIIGQKIYSVQSWKELMLTLCSKLYEFDKELFYFLIDNLDFKGRERNFLSKDGLDLRSADKIAENLFVETNLSADSIINYCKILVDKFHFEEEIRYSLIRRKKEKV